MPVGVITKPSQGGSSINVDQQLDENSENAIANKAVAIPLNALIPAPEYTLPIVSLGLSNRTVEKGSSVNTSANISVSNGDSGGAIAFRLFRNNSLVPSSGQNNTINEVNIQGNISFYGEVDFAATPEDKIKENVTGNKDYRGSIQQGDTFNTPTRNFTMVLPVFYMVSQNPMTAAELAAAITAGQANKLVVSSSGTININFNTNTPSYFHFAYPATSTTKTNWSVTALNYGNIGDGLLFNSAQTQNLDSPDGLWFAENYKLHTGGFPTSSTSNFQIKN